MDEVRPPRIAEWLLKRLLPSGYEAVVGDFAEDYADHASLYGARQAALRYWVDVLRSLPVYLLTVVAWSAIMLHNYLKVTLRTLARHKGFSAINILGLAVSMAVCLVILLFIKDQKSYDRFHAHADRTYRVYSDFKAPSNSNKALYATSPASLAGVLRTEFPGVEEAVRLVRLSDEAIANDKLLRVRGVYAEPSFFRVFDFALVSGDGAQALAEPYSVVVSPETAAKFFGDVDPVGQTLTLQDTLDFTVTGVLREPTGKTHLRPDVLVSFATLQSREQSPDFLENWEWNIYFSYTYVRLRDGAAPGALAAQLPSVIDRHYEGTDEARLHALRLQPLTAINLGQQMGNQIGRVTPAETVYFLGALALIIMLIACFNYVSLSVARALKRSREVGIRKVVGAHRGQLVRQFLAEAVLLAFLALGAACVALVWLVPAFNSQQTAEAAIALRLSDWSLYLLFGGFAVLVGIGAGLYPALYLSSFMPVQVLKGRLLGRGRSGFTVHKVLVVMQFTASLVFIISTALLYKQFTHIAHTEYGFDQEHVLNVALEDVSYDAFRNELLKHPEVVGVSTMTPLPGSSTRWDSWMRTEGMTDRVKGYNVIIDEHTLDNLGLTLLAGRNFSPQFPSDQARAVILNEKAIQQLALGTPAAAINQTVILDDSTRVQVIGVVKDYRYYSALAGIDPVILQYAPPFFQHANVRVRAGAGEGTVAVLEEVWQKLGSLRSLDYERFETQLAASNDVQDLRRQLDQLGLAALFAVFIACLGLLGMAAYSAEVRVKEVGIRKALGASVPGIVLELSGDFLKLIGVAVVLAMPLAWWLNTLWLQEIGNRVSVGPDAFVAGIAVLLVLALLTVGSQMLRAARLNPIDTLRHE